MHLDTIRRAIADREAAIDAATSQLWWLETCWDNGLPLTNEAVIAFDVARLAKIKRRERRAK